MYARSFSALAALALTAGTVVLAAPAEAASAAEDAVEVRIDDLNLSTDAGVARLERRVKNASRRICGNVGFGGIEMHRMVVDCQAKVVANAKRDVQTAIAEARSSERLALRTR